MPRRRACRFAVRARRRSPPGARSSCTCGPRTSACTSTAASDARTRSPARVREGRVPRRVLPRRPSRSTASASRSRRSVAELHAPSSRSHAPATGCASRLPPERMRVSALTRRARVRWHVASSRSPRAARGRAARRTGPTALAQALLLAVVRGARRCSCSAPLGDDPRQERPGQGRRVRRPRQFRDYFADARAAAVDLEQLWVATRGHRDHRAARVHLRLRAHAQLHAAARRCSATDRADADARAVAAGGDLVHHWFGNQGALKGCCMGQLESTGRPASSSASIFATFPHALMILVTALLARRRAAVRGRRRAGHAGAGASSSPSRCRGAQVRARSAPRWSCSRYAVTDFGIPKVIGGNFNVLADRHLQAGDRPAELQHAARWSACMLLLPVLLAFVVDWLRAGRQQAQFSARAVPYVPRPAPRLRRARCSPSACIVARADAGGARHGGLRVVRQALAVRPVVQPASTTRCGLIDAGVDRRVLQQPEAWRC